MMIRTGLSLVRITIEGMPSVGQMSLYDGVGSHNMIAQRDERKYLLCFS